MSDKLYADHFEMPDGRLVYVQDEETANKVDKVAGMGLSQNSFTDAEKTKLAGIASGAEVNAITSVQKNGTALPINNKTVNVTVPTAVSQLTNDADFASKKFVTGVKKQLAGRKFVFIGDSYGDGYSPDGSVEGWCDRVKTYLGLTLGTNYWTNHAGGACFGRSDNTSFESLLANVNVPASEKANITDIVIGGGYNDYAWSTESINSGMDRVETVVNNNFPNATVWVFAIGWTNSCQVRRQLCQRYDEAYMRTCNSKLWRYRELYQQLQYKYYFSSDYIHPNASGLYLISNCIAGALIGSEEAEMTNVIPLSISGTNVGNACRVGKYIHVRLWGSSLQTDVIQAGNLSDTGQTISSPYIMGGTSAAENTVDIPAVILTSGGLFFNTTITVAFRTQSDGTVKIYAAHNCVKSDHSAYIGADIKSIQIRGCSFEIPICDA